MPITQNESLMFQATAMCNLLVEMKNNNFLNSDEYSKNYFKRGAEYCKEVLDRSSLGNPATLQMMLYLLLVVPKEISIPDIDNTVATFCDACPNFNITYSANNPKSSESHDKYVKHIRNALAHAHCTYLIENDESYVIFRDENPDNPSQYVEIKMKTGDAGTLIYELLTPINNYVNQALKRK